MGRPWQQRNRLYLVILFMNVLLLHLPHLRSSPNHLILSSSVFIKSCLLKRLIIASRYR